MQPEKRTHEFTLAIQDRRVLLPARRAVLKGVEVDGLDEGVAARRGVDDADDAFGAGMCGREKGGEEELGEVEVT